MYIDWINLVQNNPSAENFRLRTVVRTQFLPLIEQIMRLTPISIPESSLTSEGSLAASQSTSGSPSSFLSEISDIIGVDSFYQVEISIPQKIIPSIKL